MKGLVEKPGTTAAPAPVPLGRAPPAMIYEVMGEVFDIVGLGKAEHVITK
jgi:hypothetical protein